MYFEYFLSSAYRRESEYPWLYSKWSIESHGWGQIYYANMELMPVLDPYTMKVVYSTIKLTCDLIDGEVDIKRFEEVETYDFKTGEHVSDKIGAVLAKNSNAVPYDYVIRSLDQRLKLYHSTDAIVDLERAKLLMA